MKPKHVDTAVGLVVASVLLIGGVATWEAYQQWVALEGMEDHMGSSMTAMHGTNPLWYLLGTIFIASVTVGVYVGVREWIISLPDGTTPSEPANDTTGTEQPEQLSGDHTAPRTESEAKRRILDLLPDDERRILEPVLDSPGLTQIELRDRSNFSKSKVSQTVTDLEKRGLLYREPQGRTYRIYPAEDVENEQ